MVMAAHVVVASKCLAEEVIGGFGLGEDLVSKLVDLLPVEVVHNYNHIGGDPGALLDQCAHGKVPEVEDSVVLPRIPTSQYDIFQDVWGDQSCLGSLS